MVVCCGWCTVCDTSTQSRQQARAEQRCLGVEDFRRLLSRLVSSWSRLPCRCGTAVYCKRFVCDQLVEVQSAAFPESLAETHWTRGSTALVGKLFAMKNGRSPARGYIDRFTAASRLPSHRGVRRHDEQKRRSGVNVAWPRRALSVPWRDMALNLRPSFRFLWMVSYM